MSVKNFLLKLVGKKDFDLDYRITKIYLLRQCWKYGVMMIRGFRKVLLYPKISKIIFIGAHVKLIEKRLISIGIKCRIDDRVYIDALSTDGISMGDNVIIGRNTRIECTGGLQNIGKGIKIGNRSTFGSDCYFGAAGGIEIGEDVIAGQYIRFHSENHNFNDLDTLIKEQGVTHKGIKIGNNCWIGSGVVFLDGSEIGDGCVVGANAVVTKTFSDNVIICGNPAKILAYRKDQNEKFIEK